MKKHFSTFSTFAMMMTLAAAAVGAQAATVSGWISDSMCGAKHSDGRGAKCVKSCIETMGSKPVFVDEGKKAVWSIDNPDAVKAYWGAHVTVSATLNEARKSLHIDTIAAAK